MAKISGLPPASQLTGTEKLAGFQGSSDVAITPSNLLTYVQNNGVGGGVSGDAYTAKTVANFQATSWPAGTTVVYIQGYTVPGYGGFFVRRTASQPTHLWRFQSADGGWWEGYAPDWRIPIECFGGSGNNSSDNLAAFNTYMDFVYKKTIEGVENGSLWIYSNTVSAGYKLLFGPGIYYCSDTLLLKATTSLEGLNSGLGAAATVSTLLFPVNKGGIIVCDRRTPNGVGWSTNPAEYLYGNGATGSVIRGLFIKGSYNIPLKWYANGITLRTRATIDNCNIEGFGCHAICIRATAVNTSGDYYGNINGWIVRDCSVNYVGGHALYIQGGDSNVGVSYNFNVNAARLAGIFDDSFLGCTHVAPHAEACGVSQVSSSRLPQTGVTPMVYYKGNYFYCLINSFTDTSPTAQRTPPPSTATDNQYWALANLTADKMPPGYISPVNYIPQWGQVQDDDGLVYTVVDSDAARARMWIDKPSATPSVWGTGVPKTTPSDHQYLQWAMCAKMAAGTGDTNNDYVGANGRHYVGPYSKGGSFATRDAQSGATFLNTYTESGQWPLAMLQGATTYLGGVGESQVFRVTDSGGIGAFAHWSTPKRDAAYLASKAALGLYSVGTIAMCTDASAASITFRGIMTGGGNVVTPVFWDGTYWRYI